MNITQAQSIHLRELVALDARNIGDERRQGTISAAITQGCAWLAEDQGEVAGFALVHQHFFDHPFIELLMVHPAQRRRGVASALLAAIEARYAPDKLFTSTNQSNLPMQALCAARGYLAAGVVLHLDPSDPELIFVKLL
ncbi:MAG: GNAT family N-acetyltransferase [Ktedonobacterales bacterium]|nr:GNAT family N-acetyltransferase [Ktedonobacterales bacterium]